MTLMQVGLDDKYRLDAKRIYLSGIQALVRLPMLQRERDRLQDLNTAGFISGYRGSPLGLYDNALWRAKSFLQSHDIAFVPGLNEDLAATAVWGSQQVGMFPGAKVDGVFGIWYGKGPGVDRSLDALKHANSAGTSRNGGVLALAGDDHGCQSSTLAHQSEQVFAAALMPVFNPATLQDYLDLGLYGFALSRFSGCWVGFKAISETVESSASIYSDPARIQIVLPSDFEMPPGGLSIRWPDPPLEAERRLHGPKMAAIAAFARANRLDRVVLDSKPARLGIIATGKAYLDLRQALADLGITERDAQELGLRIYKVALAWPLEESGARKFAGRAGGRGKARLHRRSAGAHSLQHGCLQAPLRRRQARRTGREAAAERRRTDADHGRFGHRRAAAPARAPKPGAGTATGAARGVRKPRGHSRADGAAADAVFLFRLPAQHLHQGSGRQPRDGRHRLSRHGAGDPEPAHRDHLAYGRRRRELDRSGALHQRASHLPEPRRRHLHPLRPAGAAGRGRRRRQHHLQDSLQRRGRDDRRTTGRGRPDRLADCPSGVGRRRQARRYRLRRSRQISKELFP